MIRSLSHMYFGKPFASASVIGMCGYWRGQENCDENNCLEKCER